VVARQDGHEFNRALWIDTAGRWTSYDKQHLVPGWEDRFQTGVTLLSFPTAAGRAGIAICKDLDFGNPARAYRRLGTGLLLAPAWDFRGRWGNDGWSHGRIAILRGVEQGFSVARAARVGRLVLSDAHGRVLAEQPSRTPVSTLIAEVPAGPPLATVYAAVGDLWGWLALALAVWLRVAPLGPARLAAPVAAARTGP